MKKDNVTSITSKEDRIQKQIQDNIDNSFDYADNVVEYAWQKHCPDHTDWTSICFGIFTSMVRYLGRHGYGIDFLKAEIDNHHIDAQSTEEERT